MVLIACVGSFNDGALWLEGGGLLDPSIKDKKRHTRVHEVSEFQGWACQAMAEALVLFNTRALHTPFPWDGQR